MAGAGRRTHAERVAESSRRLRAAFAELLIERGYERTTAAEVGKRAGYSRAMVRERFGSKEDLLAAIAADFEHLIFESAGQTGKGAPVGSGLRRALAGIDGLARLAEQDPLVLRALFVVGMESVTAGHVFRDTWLATVGRVRSSYTDWLTEGVTDGSVPPGIGPDIAGIVDEMVVDALGAAYLFAQDGDQSAFLNRINHYRGAFVARCASAPAG